MSPWYFNPHSGGSRIPDKIQDETRKRILKEAERAGYASKGYRIDVRFRNQFCYIDALKSGEEVPTHLCRLRWSEGPKSWSLAFYSYANETYKPCVYGSGDWHGTPEEALKIGSVYLN